MHEIVSIKKEIARSARAPRRCVRPNPLLNTCRGIQPCTTSESRVMSPISPNPLSRKVPSCIALQNRNPIAPAINLATTPQLLRSRHRHRPRFLRVFPHRSRIFDRRFKNAHIISAALPTAVGTSLRPAIWQAGQAKRLRNARRITMSFRTRRPLRGLQEPGPAMHHPSAGPSSCVSGVSHLLAPGAVRLRKSCRLCPYD